MQLISEFMNADHAKLDGIFAEFQQSQQQQQSSDTDRAQELFDEFMAGLQKHILWEEEILFPIFEKRTGMTDGGPTSVMRMEHGHIKGMLEEMNATILGSTSAGLDVLATQLLELLGSHNRKEENVLYPAIDQMVTDAELEKVFTDMSAISPT